MDNSPISAGGKIAPGNGDADCHGALRLAMTEEICGLVLLIVILSKPKARRRIRSLIVNCQFSIVNSHNTPCNGRVKTLPYRE